MIQGKCSISLTEALSFRRDNTELLKKQNLMSVSEVLCWEEAGYTQVFKASPITNFHTE